jgi:DNA polymerase I
MSVLHFDLETSGKDIFTYQGDFLRLWGAMDSGGAPVMGTDHKELIARLNAAPWISGHNIYNFDLLALAYHAGADYEALTAKAIDTMLMARLDYPPLARDTQGSEDKYDLDHVAERLGVVGKTDNLRELARKHGGFDQIPLDDPEYRAYLAGDLEASAAVFARMRRAWTPYAKREHKVASLFGRMTLNGFRVDVPLLHQRIDEGEAHKQEALHILADDYGLPLGRWTWKGRAKDKEETWTEFDSPLSSLEGREWLIDVYEAYGVTQPPTTDKGRLSTSAESLQVLSENEASHPDLRRILRLMSVVTTTRTVYQTLADHLTPEGRVHALVNMGQASGRSSVTSPGLTVLGKRGERWRERMVLVPEPGHVLISFDMKQLDMRAVAALSQDPAYIEMCQPGKDLHTEIATQIFGSPDFRTKAKPIGHGYNYSQGANALIAKGHDPKLVRTFYSEMGRKFPRVSEWQSEARRIGESGELLDNGFGRKMRCQPGRAYTQAPALSGQGCAADIMKEAMLRMPEEFRPNYRAFVHDELVFDFPADDVEEASREVMRAMEFEWRGVPILADMSEPGENWGRVSAK